MYSVNKDRKKAGWADILRCVAGRLDSLKHATDRNSTQLKSNMTDLTQLNVVKAIINCFNGLFDENWDTQILRFERNYKGLKAGEEELKELLDCTLGGNAEQFYEESVRGQCLTW